MQYKVYYVMGIEGDNLLISAHDLEKSSKIRLKRSEAPKDTTMGDFIDVLKDDDGKVYMQLNKGKKEMLGVLRKIDNEMRNADDKARFEYEKLALDTAVFIPVDFKLADKYNPNNIAVFTKEDEKMFDEMVRAYIEDSNINPETLPDTFLDSMFKTIDPRLAAQLEYNHGCYNLGMLDTLKEMEKIHGMKIFKHISYKQMEGIYVKGTLDKSSLKQNTNPPSGEKYATDNQIIDICERMIKQRAAYMIICRTAEGCAVT